jgi:hypothetical protein
MKDVFRPTVGDDFVLVLRRNLSTYQVYKQRSGVHFAYRYISQPPVC